jgi:hypothetical protein
VRLAHGSERAFGGGDAVYVRLGAGYTSCMRFRVGLLAGFAVGYYLGSKAGRERYEQIRRWIEDARRSGPAEKAQAAVELGLERVRQKSEAVTGSTNGPSASS